MIRWAAVVACVVAALAVVAGAPAGAIAPEQTGWWWRVQDLPIGVPVAPTTEEGQLMVSDAPDGPTAIGALRFTLAEGETAPVLTLKAANEANPDGMKVVACPALTPWSPGDAQAWNSRPAANCAAQQAEGSRAEDGTWTFALAGFSEGDSYDVVLQPAEPESGVRTLASVTFEKPGPDAVTATPASTGGDFTFEPAPEEPVSENFSPDFEDEVALPPPFETPAPQATDSPSLGATPGRLAGRPAAPPVGVAAPVSEGITGRPGLAALILFAGAAIAATRLRESPITQSAVFAHITRGRRRPAAEPQPGGLAQFVRPRVGKPNPLT